MKAESLWVMGGGMIGGMSLIVLQELFGLSFGWGHFVVYFFFSVVFFFFGFKFSEVKS